VKILEKENVVFVTQFFTHRVLLFLSPQMPVRMVVCMVYFCHYSGSTPEYSVE
jgi:hypothetical protein